MSDTPDLPPPPGPHGQPPPPPGPAARPGPPTPSSDTGTPEASGAPGASWRDELGVGGDGPASAAPPDGTDATDPDLAATTGDPDRDGDVGRTGLVLAMAVALLIVLGLVAVVVQREPAQLGLDTPEGTVQAWLQSVVDEEPRTDLLDPASSCPATVDLGYRDDDVRARVLEATDDGERATVELAITEGTSSGPLDTPYTHDETFELRRTGDAWLITGYGWPYDGCWNDEVEG